MKIDLRFHKRDCYTCRYLRYYGSCAECLLLGRGLSQTSLTDATYCLRARLCDGWKRRPHRWTIHCGQNPHFYDVYIPRESLMRIRKRAGVGDAR